MIHAAELCLHQHGDALHAVAHIERRCFQRTGQIGLRPLKIGQQALMLVPAIDADVAIIASASRCTPMLVRLSTAYSGNACGITVGAGPSVDGSPPLPQADRTDASTEYPRPLPV